MPHDRPPRNARTLRRRVDGHARTEGIATGRLQRWVSYMVLVGALDRARDLHDEPLFIVKGGVAMELRLKLDARATKDFDATFRDAAGRMLDRLDEALAEPYGGFTFTRSEIEDVGPTRAKRLDVALAYEGRSWSTVRLELTPAEGESVIAIERVPAIDVTQFGLEGPHRQSRACRSACRSPRSCMHARLAEATAGITIGSET